MDFDFFNEWEQIGTIKVGRQLSGKLVRLRSLEKMDVDQSTFPEGHSDEGCEVERYVLGGKKYLFAKEISNILSDECHKLSKEPEESSKSELSSEASNPQVLVKLLALVLDPKATHFSLG